MTLDNTENAPRTSDTPNEHELFYRFVETTRIIKKDFVDPRRTWYAEHNLLPFLLFRISGTITIVLGAVLPAIALANFPHKEAVLSAMGVLIAILTGLSSFYRWERSWRGRELSKFTIDALEAKWELEVANASYMVDASERLRYVYTATNDFFSNVRTVSATETDEFFSGLQFPESDKSSKR